MLISLIFLILIWILPASCMPIHAQRAQSQLLKFIASLLVVVGHQTVFYANMPKLVVAEQVSELVLTVIEAKGMEMC